MRKKVGIIKRVLCLCLVFLLSINSFAAILSDNDGSAFITKAEFDALKNSFQTQIDTYNTSIDSKIDGAIASYLSGIKLSTTETLSPLFDTSKTIKCVQTGTLSRTKENRSQYTVTGTQGRSGHVDFQSAAAGCWTEPGQGDLWYTLSDKPDVVQRYYKKGFLNIIWGYNFILTQNVSIAGNGNEGIMVLRSTETSNKTLDTSTSITISEATFAGTTTSPLPWTSKYGAVPWNAATTKETSGTYSNNGNVATYTLNLKDPDDTIYLYTSCDEKYINVASEADSVVETYNDIFVNPTSPTATITKTTEGFFQQANFKLTIRTTSDTTYLASTMFQGKKRRIKQTTAVSKGFTAFNNLNQLKNGGLSYNLGGSTKYPSFYGGLPLFVLGAKAPVKVQFKIKINGTTSKIKLWVKKGEFLNNSNIATWPTADQNDICKISASGATVGGDKSLSINNNVETLITVEDGIETNNAYFLRFCEDGRTYGGQLMSLSDIVVTYDN